MEQNIINAMKGCSLFQDIGEQELSNILNNCPHKTITFIRNECYCLCGDMCRNVDIVVSGEMVVRMTGLSGRQVEVTKEKRGDIIAPCYIFSTDKRLPVEITPSERTTILRLSTDTLDNLVERNATIRRNFIRVLSDIATFLAERISFLSLMTAHEKIICFLRSEVTAQHSLHLTLSLSRQRIADSFGIQKFSLLRCLADLSRQGIIRVEGKVIDILDIRRLK